MEHKTTFVPATGRRERTISKKLVILCAVACIVALTLAGWLFVQNRDLQRKVGNKSAVHEISNDEIARKVAAVYDAPNEKPSVAQVADKSKLSNEPFFQNAKKGDYVVVYPKAKIALIYRLSDNKVVNIGPISTGQAQ